jgi:hypothetical protein
MSSSRYASKALPVEEFLQAIGEQLDLAQDALAVKARTGRPLTWALRELKLDLHVFIELDDQGRLTWRSAGPNEGGASTVHLEFTTITRPMIEENTWSLLDDADPRSVDEIGDAAELSGDERRRLNRLGVRTVGQLRRLEKEAKSREAMSAMVGIPIGRLQRALQASARPSVSSHEVVQRRGGDERLLRIRGVNLSDGIDTEVRLAGEPVEVIEAQPGHLLVRPLEHHEQGQIEIVVGGERATGYFRMPPVYGGRAAQGGASGGPGNGAHGGNGNGASGNGANGADGRRREEAGS